MPHSTRQQLRYAAVLSTILFAAGIGTMWAAAFSGAEIRSLPVLAGTILTFVGCCLAGATLLLWRAEKAGGDASPGAGTQ